jgi:mono/diheme cytochrome c family protein
MRRLALLVPLLLVSAGCLDGKKTTATPSKMDTTVVKTTATQVADGDAKAGKIVFTKTASPPCAGCHTLKDAGATGQVGPNLDNSKPAKELIVERVTKGKGAMPPFKGVLSDTQIADVVAYVYSATHT